MLVAVMIAVSLGTARLFGQRGPHGIDYESV